MVSHLWLQPPNILFFCTRNEADKSPPSCLAYQTAFSQPQGPGSQRVTHVENMYFFSVSRSDQVRKIYLLQRNAP